MGERVAIVGIGQTHHTTRRPDVNWYEMVNEAVRAALEDAELEIKDIDAVVIGNMDLFEGHYLVDNMAAEYSGAFMKPGLKLGTGGTTGGTLSAGARHLVASGLYDVVLTIGWEKHDESHAQTGLMTAIEPLTERPFTPGAIGFFAMMSMDYMRRSGCQEIHGAMVRVKAAENACKNPYAHLKLNITVDDVLKSAMLAYPLRMLHMCPQSTGACALIMANEERARRITNKPVWYKDCVTTHSESWFRGWGLGVGEACPSHLVCAQKFYKRNGLDPKRDIHVFEMYEPSTWAELNWMDEFGLCDSKGEAWQLVERGETTLSGRMPINPSGGVVSCNPIGATSMIRVAEAALQVRGDGGERQVTREVTNAVATSFGGSYWTIMHLLTKNLD